MTKISKTETGWNKKPLDVEYSIQYIIRSISSDGLIKVPEDIFEYEWFETHESALAECARLGLYNAIILPQVCRHLS